MNTTCASLSRSTFRVSQSIGTVHYPGGERATVTLCLGEDQATWVEFRLLPRPSLIRRVLKHLKLI